MAFWNQFPYTNFHELNTDWIVAQVKELAGSVENCEKDIADYKGDIANALAQILDQPTLSQEVYNAMAQFGVVANVKSYGAVGDDKTDDLTAFTKCLTENAGNVVYMPAGTYRLSGTIYIPSKTQLVGAGSNTVLHFIGSGNCIQYEGDESNYCIFSNFVVKGNAGGGDGFNIYGDGNIYQNITVTECGENGFHLHYRGANVDEFGALTRVVNCSAYLNGEHGYYGHDILDSQITNCTFYTNSQKKDNTYDNIHCESAVKISNSHSWNWNDERGYRRIRYALWIKDLSTVVGCHIEGGRTGCARIRNRNTISGNAFYASFGNHNIKIAGMYNQIFATVCTGPANDRFVSVPMPKWRGDIIFDDEEWCNGNNIDISTVGIPIDFSGSDGKNVVKLSGDTVHEPVNDKDNTDICHYVKVNGAGYFKNGYNANVPSGLFHWYTEDREINIGEEGVMVLTNCTVKIKHSDCKGQGQVVYVGINGSGTINCTDGSLVGIGTSYTATNSFTLVATDIGFIIC